MEKELSVHKQVITLVDGAVFTMGGVLDIAGFDEGYVALDTENGRIVIEGENMKIESLSKEGGNILIKGDINAILRSDVSKKKKGFFGR